MQPQILTCTLTGIEDSTDLNRLYDLSAEFPFVEWGVLMAGDKAGSGRFPTRRWLERLADQIVAHPEAASFALHLCGGNAQSYLFSPASGVTSELAKVFPRIQLNFFSRKYETADIAAAILAAGRSRVITQHNRANAGLARALLPFNLANHDVLFDQSGGRSQRPSTWPTIDADVAHIPHGYSGGLGPDNLVHELESIAIAAAGRAVSIDMEGSMRNASDSFDLSKARRVLEIVSKLR